MVKSALPGSDPPMIKIYCDDASHEGKIATVDHIGRSPTSGRVVSYGLNVMDGPSAHPDWLGEMGSHENLSRGRLALKCRLCGLSVPLANQDLASKLYDGILAAGATSVRLASIQRFVS